MRSQSQAAPDGNLPHQKRKVSHSHSYDLDTFASGTFVYSPTAGRDTSMAPPSTAGRELGELSPMLDTRNLGHSSLGLLNVPPIPRAALFNDDMLVLAFERGGKRSSSFTLTFTLSDEQMRSLSLWAERYSFA